MVYNKRYTFIEIYWQLTVSHFRNEDFFNSFQRHLDDTSGRYPLSSFHYKILRINKPFLFQRKLVISVKGFVKGMWPTKGNDFCFMSD